MVTVEALEAEADVESRAEKYLLPVDTVLQHLPRIDVEPGAAERLCQGQKVLLEQAPEPGRYRIYDAASAFIGIGELAPSGELFPKRIFI